MSAAFLPRWAAIVIGAPLVSRLTLDRLSQGMQYAIVLGVSWAACSVLFAPDRMSGALQFFFLLATVGAFIAASEWDSLDDAMTGLALGIGVSSILSVLFLFGIHTVEQGTPTPAGLFYNGEVLSEFAAPVFLWTILKKRWWLAALTFLPIVDEGSRVAVLVVCLGLLYFYRPRSKILTVGLFAGALFAAASAILFYAVYAGGVEKFGTAGTRAVIWLATAYAINPIGHGLSWFETAHPVEQFAHSDAIQAMAELGLGSIFLLAIPVLILRSKGGTNAERAVFVAICAEVFVSFPLHVPSGAFLAAIVAGYLAGRRPALSMGRSDGRDRNAQDDQRRRAIARSIDGRGELGDPAFPFRSSPPAFAALGCA
jgi:hypothetical protein